MEHLQDMFIERGFTVKESKECGAGGSMVIIFILLSNIRFQQHNLFPRLFWRWRAQKRLSGPWQSCTITLRRNTRFAWGRAISLSLCRYWYNPSEFLKILLEIDFETFFSSSRTLLVSASHSVQPESNLTLRRCIQDFARSHQPRFSKAMNWVALAL